MKLRSLVLIGFLSCFTSLYAENQHLHPQQQVAFPGPCEIEIINRSYSDVRVNGIFDDGVSLVPFNVYSFGYPQYISLYYYGYCHDGMNLYIETYYGTPVFSGYVPRFTTLRLVPEYYGSTKLKAVLEPK